MDGVFGEAAGLDRREVLLQLRCGELIEGPSGLVLKVTVDMLPIPVDRLRASAQHLQVEQPLTNQLLKARLCVAVRGSRQYGSRGLLVSVLGGEDGTEQFLLSGTRPPWQPLGP